MIIYKIVAKLTLAMFAWFLISRLGGSAAQGFIAAIITMVWIDLQLK